MSAIEFRTLGTLDLRAADGRELHSLLAQPKRIALLAYLCVAEPRGFHRRDTLLGLFWPDSDQEHARTSLRKSVHVLRRALGEDAIVSRGDDEIDVDRSRISCDVDSFEALVRASRFQEALEVYRGDLLTGFFVDEAPEFERWLHTQRARLRSAAARAAFKAAEQLERSGDYASAVRLAERSLDLSETDEHTLRKLIGLHVHAGDRAAAIATYESFARKLAAEFQTEPSAETRSLVDQIRKGAEGSPTRREGSKHTDPGVVRPKTSEPRERSQRERALFAAAALAVLISAGFIWGLLRPPTAARVLRFTLVVDSTEPLAVAMPFAGRLAISPDGSRLAYLSGSRNGPDARVLRIREWNDLHAAALAGTEEGFTPFFSPDGRSVGFLRQHSVWIASTTGGPPIQISDSLSGIAGASWASDGFIYVDGFEFKPLARVEAKPKSAARWFTSLDSARGEVDHMWPFALPNAKGVLFTVTFSGKDKADGQPTLAIAVAEIPSGKHRIIIKDGTYPVYLSSGRLLYVNSKRALMMVPFDQSSMTITGQPTALIEGMRLGSYGATDLAVSNNGTLVYSLGAGLSRDLGELLWVSRDGKTTPVDPNWHGLFSRAEVSPDGKLLAVEKSLDGQGTDVWIKNLETGAAIKLTEPSYAGDPIWRPDGKSVTLGAAVAGHGQYLTRRADGSGDPTILPHAEVIGAARWSPDGKWLVGHMEKSDTRADIIAMRPGIDTEPLPLIAGEFYKVIPEISPDGHWLAYQSDETGLYQIYVVPFPNTKAGKWVVTTKGGIFARWGRADELFYRDTSGDFFSVPVKLSPTFSAGTPRHLLTAKRIEYPLGGYSVAPDDRLVVIRLLNSRETDKIVVVENWFEELKHSPRGNEHQP